MYQFPCFTQPFLALVLPPLSFPPCLPPSIPFFPPVLTWQCERNNVDSFDDAWGATVGEKSKWVLSSSIVTTTVLACLSYSMIIGDLVSALAVTAGATGLAAKRSTAILGVTAFVVGPLCFLKSLAALQYTSLLGVLGVLFTVAVMGLRFFDG